MTLPCSGVGWTVPEVTDWQGWKAQTAPPQPRAPLRPTLAVTPCCSLLGCPSGRQPATPYALLSSECSVPSPVWLSSSPWFFLGTEVLSTKRQLDSILDIAVPLAWCL